MRRGVLRSLRVLAGTVVAGTVGVLAGQEPESYETKSPGVARGLSFLGTAVLTGASAAFALAEGTAVPLVFGGLVLGPVLGYVYAGEARRGIVHAGIRAAVIGVTAGAAFLICSERNCDLLAGAGPELGLAMAVVAAGGAITAFLIGRDIIRVGDQVRARSQRLGAVSVQPAYFPESRSGGLVFSWRH
jgi:4-amino-4-deoxy-L-arabinose transferase-like glycosyltransferase